MLVIAVSCGSVPGQRIEQPWTPAEARVERVEAPNHPGLVEIVFVVSAAPEALALAIRQHYAQQGWRERSALEAFKWHESRGGGVLAVPGQPNPIVIGWCGEWVSGTGDILFYSLRARKSKPSEPTDVHAFASFRERRQYFEQCGV